MEIIARGQPCPEETSASPDILFRVDWLGITIYNPSLDLVASQIINILCVGTVDGLTRKGLGNWREVAEQAGYGGRCYKDKWLLPLGITIYVDPIQKARFGLDHVHVEIKGEALAGAGVQAVHALYGFLNGYYSGGWKHTRLDLAWDHCPFTPLDLYSALMANQVRTLAKRDTMSWYETPFGPEKGSTCNLGARASERMIRAYDKRGFTRLELQLRGERAAQVGGQLAGQWHGEWAGISLGHLRDYLDMVDRESADNISRADLLPWWREFIQGAKRAGLVLARSAVDSLKKARQWFMGSVAPMMACILQGVSRGDEEKALAFLLEALDAGKRRWRKRHRAILATAGCQGVVSTG